MYQSQICEYAVKQKTEGIWIRRKILLVVLYAVILLVFPVFDLLLRTFPGFLMIGAIVDFALYGVTWRYTKVEYEYAMMGGVLSFSKIYGGNARKLMFETPMSSIDAVFPYHSEKGKAKLEAYAPEEQYFALSTRQTDENDDREIWCCLFRNENDTRAAFYFEMCDKAYVVFRQSCPAVTAARMRRSDEVLKEE